MKRVSKLLVILAFSLIFVVTTGYTQTTRTFSATVTNVCQQGTLIVNTIVLSIVTQNGSANSTAAGPVALSPGQSITVEGFTFFSVIGTPSDPNAATVSGTFQDREYVAEFNPLIIGQSQVSTSAGGAACVQLLVLETTQDDDGSPTPQPTDPDSKPISGGESLEQTLNTLTASGFQVTQDGSESSPKLSNVNDPILLRGINAFSAQVVWVSAPGLLRTVITWDNPTTDLDLLVFGISACFQLNPAGVLAELCDRAPQGPVTGAVFAVVVINWSANSQQYTMSLST